MMKSLPNPSAFTDMSRCALLQITSLIMWYWVCQIYDDGDQFKPVISAMYAYECLESWCGTQLVLGPVIAVMWHLQTYVSVVLTSIQIPVLFLPFSLMYFLELHRTLEKVRYAAYHTCSAKNLIFKAMMTFNDGRSLCHSSTSAMTRSESENSKIGFCLKDAQQIEQLLIQQIGMKAELVAYFGGHLIKLLCFKACVYCMLGLGGIWSYCFASMRMQIVC